jgi:hypothetical protein
MTGAESAPENNLRFIPAKDYGRYQTTTSAPEQAFYGTKSPFLTTHPSDAPRREPPVEGETNFNNTTNPTNHVRIPAIETENGDVRASATMAFSQDRTRTGKITASKPLPRTWNTNAAPPSLNAYGPSARSHDNSRPETSVYGNGEGGPILMSANSGLDTKSRKA